MENHYIQDNSVNITYATAIINGVPIYGMNLNGNDLPPQAGAGAGIPPVDPPQPPCPGCQHFSEYVESWPPRSQQHLDLWMALLGAYPTQAQVMEFLRNLPVEEHTCGIGPDGIFGQVPLPDDFPEDFQGFVPGPFNPPEDAGADVFANAAQAAQAAHAAMQEQMFNMEQEMAQVPNPHQGFAGEGENMAGMAAPQANPFPMAQGPFDGPAAQHDIPNDVPPHFPTHGEMLNPDAAQGVQPFIPIIPEENVLLPQDGQPFVPVIPEENVLLPQGIQPFVPIIPEENVLLPQADEPFVAVVPEENVLLPQGVHVHGNGFHNNNLNVAAAAVNPNALFDDGPVAPGPAGLYAMVEDAESESDDGNGDWDE